MIQRSVIYTRDVRKSRTRGRGEVEVTIETAFHVLRVQEVESGMVREDEAKISEMNKRNAEITNARKGGSRGDN